MRIEKKYPTDFNGLLRIRSWLQANPDLFERPYPNRIVNSLYFDSINNKSLRDNVQGAFTRFKSRLRFYGGLDSPKNPQFEIKYKRGALGSKLLTKISPDSINLNSIKSTCQKVRLQLKGSSKFYFLKADVPSVFCSYTREYYSTKDQLLRLTIDTNISTCTFEAKNKIQSKDLRPSRPYAVIELKYSPENTSEVLCHLKSFPLKEGKNSKFVNALQPSDF